MNPRIREALLGREASCDRCGAVVPREQIRSIYIGPHGEKIDYCPSCFARGERK